MRYVVLREEATVPIEEPAYSTGENIINAYMLVHRTGSDHDSDTQPLDETEEFIKK